MRSLFFLRAILGTEPFNLIHRKFVIAAESLCKLVFGTEIDLAVSYPLYI
jgi:hypothetical protein